MVHFTIGCTECSELILLIVVGFGCVKCIVVLRLDITFWDFIWGWLILLTRDLWHLIFPIVYISFIASIVEIFHTVLARLANKRLLNWRCILIHKIALSTTFCTFCATSATLDFEIILNFLRYCNGCLSATSRSITILNGIGIPECIVHLTTFILSSRAYWHPKLFSVFVGVELATLS